MREILFRGFTPTENGKDKVFVNGEWIKGQWVQGSYWKLNKTTYCVKEDYERDPDNTEHYIVFDQMTDWGLPNRHLKADVIPETVGQYTGKIISNGRVFEDDICENIDGVFLVCWDKEKSAFVMRLLEYPYETMYLEEMWDDSKIIGNLHDNPELLKEGAE